MVTIYRIMYKIAVFRTLTQYDGEIETNVNWDFNFEIGLCSAKLYPRARSIEHPFLEATCFAMVVKHSC